jgi:cell division protein ZapA
MASVEIEIASRKYAIACREGEEGHLLSVAAIVDAKAQDAAEALGTLGEARQLLFASLLLADELKEHRAGNPPPVSSVEIKEVVDPEVANALERLATRVEALAQRLEEEGGTT